MIITIIICLIITVINIPNNVCTHSMSIIMILYNTVYVVLCMGCHSEGDKECAHVHDLRVAN